MRYKTDAEIVEIIRGFEDATIPRDKWKHAEHLTVALHYLDEHDIETATAKMRSGIFKLLGAFGVDLAKEMPFHETLTIFWMRTIADFLATRNGESFFVTCNQLIAKYDKNYPHRFYSHELLFSDKARAEFVEADIAG